MDKLVIQGGNRLEGSVNISGAKNAALPLLCASLLTEDTLTLSHLPVLQDIRTLTRILTGMGVTTTAIDANTLSLCAKSITEPVAPYELVKTMRASILVLALIRSR